VHIPIDLYDFFVKPILELLLPEDGNPQNLAFLNISINPIEASVVLPKELAEKHFRPLVAPNGPAQVQTSEEGSVTIAPDDYLLMFVNSTDSQPSQHIIDLTTPLALAGISIFFITTYFSDYILCPVKSRAAVIAALEARGFELTDDYSGSSYPSANYAQRPTTASSESSGGRSPGTPPPSTLSDLQARTFATLRARAVTPAVDREIRLRHCSLVDRPSVDTQALLLTYIRCVMIKPRFFSLTFAEGEAPSVLLEQGMLPLFCAPRRRSSSGSGRSGNGNGRNASSRSESPARSLLLGTNSDVLVPIVLDLRTLPLESTGIVCGLAGRLVGATRGELSGPVEISYLSTARAGSVIVTEEDLERSLRVLDMGVDEPAT
jgi:hypothetical protein